MPHPSENTDEIKKRKRKLVRDNVSTVTKDARNARRDAHRDSNVDAHQHTNRSARRDAHRDSNVDTHPRPGSKIGDLHQPMGQASNPRDIALTRKKERSLSSPTKIQLFKRATAPTIRDFSVKRIDTPEEAALRKQKQEDLASGKIKSRFPGIPKDSTPTTGQRSPASRSRTSPNVTLDPVNPVKLESSGSLGSKLSQSRPVTPALPRQSVQNTFPRLNQSFNRSRRRNRTRRSTALNTARNATSNRSVAGTNTLNRLT